MIKNRPVQDLYAEAVQVAVCAFRATKALGVRGESVPPLRPAMDVDLQPLIARIRKEFGGDRVTASASELAQFISQIIDLTLAEVDRVPSQEKPHD